MKPVVKHKMKLHKGDSVRVITGKDKGREGKILLVDTKTNRVIVEGVNIITKHQKPNAKYPQGGLIKKEAYIHVSNVMYLHKGQTTRIGYMLETIEKNGKKVIVKKRIAKKTGDVID